MNKRLQKKCFVAAAGFHLLMLVILLVGPAFLSSGKKTEDRPPIDFIPLKTIDEALSGGGNPNARPPTPQPPASQPQPPAPRPQPQTPVRQPEPPKPVQRDPEVVPPKPTRKLPDVSLKRVTRSNETVSKKKTPPKQDTQPNNQLTQVAKAAQAAAKSIRQNVSDSPVEMPELHGPGGGGVPYANFLDGIRKRYSDAWLVPDGVTDDEATATASVTIARDGTVLSSRLIQSSGNALADQSVEMTLRRVTFAVPLPEGAKESQRTVTIKFNVKAKRGLR
jgi:TonB family protein